MRTAAHAAVSAALDDPAIDGTVHVLPQTSNLRAMHTIIRDRTASQEDFVVYSGRIIRLLLEAAMDLLPFDEHEVTTPVGACYRGLRVARELCAVPVIRAGESMEVELRDLLPSIPVGKILIQRDKVTKRPHLYYSHLPPDITDRHVLVLEPMLATGGSALTAITVVREAGVPTDQILLVTFLASPEGLRTMHAAHPDLAIVTSSIEAGLNENALMIPGIGDFGDRYFGTVITSGR